MRRMCRVQVLTALVTLMLLFILMLGSFVSCKTTQKPPDDISLIQVTYTSDPIILANISMKIYQTVLTGQDNSRCVFFPTCSHYASQAIHRYGLRGIFMGIDRLTRCHPADIGQRPYYPVLEDGTFYDPLN